MQPEIQDWVRLKATAREGKQVVNQECPPTDSLYNWVEEQKSASDPGDLVTTLDGFLYYSPNQKGGTSRKHMRVIVPVKRREEFVLWHHK